MVAFIALPFEQRNPVISLEAETMRQIVNNYHVFQLAILKNAQILYSKPVFRVESRTFVENRLDAVIFVNFLDDFLRVQFGRRRKNVNFEEFACFFKENRAKRSNIER